MMQDVWHGDDMKKAILLIVTIGAVVTAYFVGHSQGRSSGFEDGVYWEQKSVKLCQAMRAVAILGVLEQTNHAGVADALNHDIDYAILGALRADEHLANIRFPREIQKIEEDAQEFFRNTGTDEHTGYRHLAELRRTHPTKSTDRDIVEAVNELLEKY